MERAFSSVVQGAEWCFAAVGLFLFTGALLPLLLKESGASVEDLAQGNPILRFTYFAVQLGALGLLALRWRDAWAAARRNLLTLGLVALAAASVVWSAEPDLTLRRSVALVGTTAFGVYLATRYTARGLLGLVTAALGAAAALSLVFAVALPAYGVDHEVHAGAWRGVFTQKNTLGQTMALGAFTAALLGASPGRWRWAAWGCAGLCAALVVLSTSKTALAVLLTLALLIPLFRALRWRPDRALVALTCTVMAAGVAALWVAGNTEEVLSTLGRDATLTGRTTLWEAVIGRISEQPLLGYGYSAFWLGHSGASARVLESVGWETPHSHNGYLDLALDLGLVGLLIFVAGLVTAAVSAGAALRRTRGPEGLWPLAFLAFVALYNMTESVILRQNNVFWTLYVAAACSLLLAGGRGEAPAPASNETATVNPPVRPLPARRRALPPGAR